MERLDEIPGIGLTAAATVLAEIEVDMSRFPTAGHLCSWAKFSPGISSAAGKTKGNGSTGREPLYRPYVGRSRRRCRQNGYLPG
ncbi:transposase [Paenarthrobacter sp. RAF54_2]